MTYSENLNKIANHHGIQVQRVKLIEEMMELCIELIGQDDVFCNTAMIKSAMVSIKKECKAIALTKDYTADMTICKEKVAEEAADVFNVINSVCLLLDVDVDKFNSMMESKLDREIKRIEEGI